MIRSFIFISFKDVSSGKTPKNKYLKEDHDSEIGRHPQQRIQGSLKFFDIRQTRPRPPPAGVFHGNFKMCKW